MATYNYNSPTDQQPRRFLGLDLEALSKELATSGKGDVKSLNGSANARLRCAPWNRSLVLLHEEGTLK